MLIPITAVAGQNNLTERDPYFYLKQAEPWRYKETIICPKSEASREIMLVLRRRGNYQTDKS